MWRGHLEDEEPQERTLVPCDPLELGHWPWTVTSKKFTFGRELYSDCFIGEVLATQA